MQPRAFLPIASLALLAVSCTSFAIQPCKSSETVRVFQAAHIGQQWIDFAWLEVPRSAGEGTFPGRLFVGSSQPVGAIVPTMLDIPCRITAAAERIDLEPAVVDIEFNAAGDLKTSYPWKSCAPCSECYMVWTFSLDLNGHESDDALEANLVLNETFHAGPMKIVAVTMPEATQACTEPHLLCGAGGDCGDIKFQRRQ
jgi:hypothetical protein